ncbi:MAG: DUF2703 domain-containing protein [Chlorobium sp.]|jgi:hypothetical protein|nr:DUF2703 domain-containing protein [Chlorobium sp.]
MKNLSIVWQRVVNTDGKTCDRCASTLDNLSLAIKRLDESLQPLGIKVNFESKEIDLKSFDLDPSQSNKIWVAGKPIEDWLGANVASSQCCSVCGDAQCRTLAIDNQVYEAIPTELIIKATLIAASEMFGSENQSNTEKCKPGCCS